MMMTKVKNPTRLLIVEDEGLVALSIEHHLANLGYEICGLVSTGEEAVERSAAARPDIVLMDIRLEGPMDGIEAADKIRSSLNIPVVYLTSYSDVTTLGRAKITEPFGYVTKPFDEDMLRVAVEMALYKSQAQRRLRREKERLQSILRSLDEGVIVTGTRGRVVYMNPVAKRLLGSLVTSGDKRVPFPRFFRLHEADGETPVKLSISRIVQGEEHISLRNTLLTVAGDRRIPVDCTVSPLGRRGSHAGAVVTFRDVTLRRRAEQFVEGEQQRASELHRSLLPPDGLTVGRMEMHRFFRSAAWAGGDIFNFFPIDDAHAVIYSIDVVGHGVSAAGVSILLHRLLSPRTEGDPTFPVLEVDPREPVAVVEQLNRLFFLPTQQGLFFTIFYAALDTKSGAVRFTRAGHPYPLRQGADGKVVDVRTEGPAVGIVESMSLTEEGIVLRPGERLYLYSDGLTDCTNQQLEHYSEERLIDLIERSHSKNLKHIVSAVEADVSAWSGGEIADDDVSLIAVEFH